MHPSAGPPESGLITLRIPAAPVSFQAPAAKKAGIISAVRGAVSHFDYVLGGDVKLEVRWAISVRDRYERDSSADVDNIMKPILDALCGPDGLLIDDCQVQELTCYWSGGYTTPEEQRIDIELRFDPEEWFARQGLVFVQVDRGVFMPLHGDLPARFVIEQAEHFVWRFESFRRMVEEGAPLSSAYLTLPIQRVFHRSKIGAFQTATLEQLRERLGNG